MEVLRRLTEPTVSYDITVCSAFIKLYSDSWVQRHGDEPLLPGLNYTQRQLFWISGANVWCSKHRPKALKLSVITGAHSPDKFRVQVCCYEEIITVLTLEFQGAFSNMAGFARDFQCKEGSKMNPSKENKCKVW